MDLIVQRDISAINGSFTLSVEKEDLSRIYPGMVRFAVVVRDGEQILATFRTNSYEYPPIVPLSAEQVALEKADKWTGELTQDPQEFLSSHGIRKGKKPFIIPADVVIIQGSPRPGGNCSIFAGWVKTVAEEQKKTVNVIYPHDLSIRSCIGCYQCYNTGSCTFDDDMSAIIDAIRAASVLVICSPVYTNSVPGGLKLLIDRCQAYHAELTITPHAVETKKGLILSVAGRKGRSHFSCVTNVVGAFLRNLGVRPCGEILIDGMDERSDIREVPGLSDRVRAVVQDCLKQPADRDSKQV
jgi:multimeric flavodoxin WrbA